MYIPQRIELNQFLSKDLDGIYKSTENFHPDTNSVTYTIHLNDGTEISTPRVTNEFREELYKHLTERKRMFPSI